MVKCRCCGMKIEATPIGVPFEMPAHLTGAGQPCESAGKKFVNMGGKHVAAYTPPAHEPRGVYVLPANRASLAALALIAGWAR